MPDTFKELGYAKTDMTRAQRTGSPEAIFGAGKTNEQLVGIFNAFLSDNRAVFAIIDRGEMTDGARQTAKKIFETVAAAEDKAHGCPIEEVHFHEVGAIDSIVDIIAIAVLTDDLGVKDVIVDGLNEGRGFVMCQHGSLPVPVPAVLNIAAAAVLRTRDTLPASYKVLKTGIGLGKRDFGHANFLRAMIIEDADTDGKLYIIETNIDDSTAEELGMTMEKLFGAGAYDVHFEPCFMKKNRPAYMLRAIVPEKLLPTAENIIFANTTTIGLRKYAVERRCMEREIRPVAISAGTVLVKKCWTDGIVRYNPEYESVKALSEQTDIPFRKLYDEARKTAEERDNA